MSENGKENNVNGFMTNIDRLMGEAKHELNQEIMEQSKEEIKRKMRALAQAQCLVRNIERELEDLQIRIKQEIS